MAKTKAKVPKRIGGVKIPKRLRRAGRPLARFVDTPLGRAIVAEAIVSAAGALILRPQLRKAVLEAGMQAGLIGAAAVERMMHAGSELVSPKDEAKSTAAEDQRSAVQGASVQGAGVQGRGRGRAVRDEAGADQPASA